MGVHVSRIQSLSLDSLGTSDLLVVLDLVYSLVGYVYLTGQFFIPKMHLIYGVIFHFSGSVI